KGNAAFARCETAAKVASQPEAEPFAYDAAIAHGEAARRSWQLAAMSRPDWPEARRNVERAIATIEDLRKRNDDALAKKKKTEDRPQPKPQNPPEPPKDADRKTEEEAAVAPRLDELTADQVMALLERLVAKEKQKVALRRSERRAQQGGVERDW